MILLILKNISGYIAVSPNVAVQKIRKDFGLEVTDKIKISVEKNTLTRSAIKNNLTYICEETLATELKYEEIIIENATKVDLINNISINISLVKN